MPTQRNAVLSKMVALAWVHGYVDNGLVRAITGCNGAGAGARIHGAINGGHLVELPGYQPKRWGLSDERKAAIASMPDQGGLRMLAEQQAQLLVRVARIQAAERAQSAVQRRSALDRARREPTAAQRPPMLPGSQLLVPAPAGAGPGVTVRDPAPALAAAPVQDPKGLLAPRSQPPAPPAPFLLRGGLLAPADGPYIRPGAQAHQALPSRRVDGLVQHRPPLSQP